MTFGELVCETFGEAEASLHEAEVMADTGRWPSARLSLSDAISRLEELRIAVCVMEIMEGAAK